MSTIQAVRAFLMTCPSLETGALLLVDHLGETPIQYAIIPIAGQKIIEQYLDGGSLREFPFAFQSTESTADDLARLENSGFYEAFSDWLEAQTLVEILPTLGAKQTAEKIEATSWGFLYEQGTSDTGIYQIICKLTYQQQA